MESGLPSGKPRIRPAAIIVGFLLGGLAVWSFTTPTAPGWRLVVAILLYSFVTLLLGHADEMNGRRDKFRVWPPRTRSVILIFLNLVVWCFAFGFDVPMPWNIVAAVVLAILLWLLPSALEPLVWATPKNE